jgi:peptidoglycan/LPS O-acetylase OafA/YrhL
MTSRAGIAFAHRPALDGLRGLAVLGVIAFHLGYPWAGGGFLGVDIFFVLSGYLITSLLLTERSRTGRIDLGAFWARRARRLLPALGLVGAAILVAVPLTLSADELPMVRADGVATALYVANWRFASTGEAYFAQFADPSPLRHMWSLAVEEQFYLVWPVLVAVLLALVARRGVKRAGGLPGPGALIGVCAAGVAGSAALLALLYTPGSDPSRAYYGTDARMHELLVGALLAVVLHHRRVNGRPPAPRAARWIGAASAAVLVACLALLDSHQAPYFRGGSLLTAAAVAGLILAFEWGSPLARPLSLRPLRYIGRLSYGLYLWHWPVLIWMSRGVYGPQGPVWDGLRVAVTFALAAASFHLVEEPIRRGARRRAAAPRVPALAGAEVLGSVRR